MLRLLLKDFLLSNDKKLFLSSSLGETNDILKSFALNNKTSIFNIETSTVLDIAKLIFLSSDISNDAKIINTDEANILFYTFLNLHIEPMIYGLIPIESMAMSTSKMVYSTINEVRMGKKIKNTKLDTLIKDFEEFLLSHNCYDEPLLLKKSLKIIENESSNDIKDALAFGDKISIGVLVTLSEKLRYLEAEVIKALEKVYEIESSVVEIRNKEITSNVLKVSSYGYMNEIRFVLDKIRDEKLILSNVAIYVTDNKYNNLIKAVFENSNIPYVFASGDDAETDQYISLFKFVLKFLYDHLNITTLYEIYKNGALKDSYKNFGQLRNLRSDKHAIIEKVSRANASKWNEEQKEFILSIIDIYNSDRKISDIYHSLVELVNKYSYEEKQEPGKQLLISKERFISFMDSQNLSFEKKIKFILDLIEGLKIPITCNEKSYVEIRGLSNATFLDKKYNFVVGLSAKQFEVKEIQSPLFSDDEFIEHLDTNYYVEISKGKNGRYINQVLNLFKTLDDGYIYLIRSEYDSSELKSLAPSIILNYFENEISSVNHYKDLTSSTKQCSLLKEEILDEESSKSIIDRKHLSPSSLEELMNCPLNFIYAKTCEQIKLDEYDGNWLKQGDFGTFAHKILEEYFKLPNSSSNYDENYLNECFKLAFESIISEMPFEDSTKVENEANDVFRVVKKYLEKYYSEKNPDEPYRVIGTECNFKDVSLCGISFGGQIDRIDAFVDVNKQLHIRIIDYKTTSKSSFKDKASIGLITQCVIYPLAVTKWVKENENKIKSIVGSFNSIDENNITFIYELLKPGEQNIYLKDDQNKIQLLIQDAIEKFDLFIKDPTVDNFIDVYQPEVVKVKKEERDKTRCKYCDFKTICHFKMHYGEDKGWMK